VRGDALVHNQRLITQAVFGIAHVLEQGVGLNLRPITFAELADALPEGPKAGMLACISDSTVNTWGAVIAGGGGNIVLGFYDGAHWVVK
jgi:hypothetical protein